MIKKLLNLFSSNKSNISNNVDSYQIKMDKMLEKWFEETLNWQINDAIEINMDNDKSLYSIYKRWRLLAFDSKGNVTLEYYNDQIANVNLINSRYRYYNYSLQQRIEKDNYLKLKKQSEEYQNLLSSYREEYNKLTLNDKNGINLDS